MGKELVDLNSPVTSYNVVDGSILHLVIRANVVAEDAEPRRNSNYMDLENQPGIYSSNFNSAVSQMGFMSERVFDAYRLSRLIGLLTLLDVIQVIFFSVRFPILFLFIILPICGFYAASKLRPWLILPVCLLVLCSVPYLYIVSIVRLVSTDYNCIPNTNLRYFRSCGYFWNH